MNSPQPERRTVRYPLHLPVSIRTGKNEIHAHSENISTDGILLSSASAIPEGSPVELSIGVAQLPDHGMLLTAKGKVTRAQPKPSGNFAIAIRCERSFEFRQRRADKE